MTLIGFLNSVVTYELAMLYFRIITTEIPDIKATVHSSMLVRITSTMVVGVKFDKMLSFCSVDCRSVRYLVYPTMKSCGYHTVKYGVCFRLKWSSSGVHICLGHP